MGGLNVRTVQRIEKGEPASMETIKAINALFEVEFVADDNADLLNRAKAEERYIQKLKGMYKLLAAGVLSLLLPLYQALMGHTWKTFLWVLFSWAAILIIYAIGRFDLFDAHWRERMIRKKFGPRD